MLQIFSTDDAKMSIQGTSIVIESVVSRISFSAPLDGKTIGIAQAVYGTKESYKEGGSVLMLNGFSTEFKHYSLLVSEDPNEYLPQSLDTAQRLIAKDLTKAGFVVKIIE